MTDHDVLAVVLHFDVLWNLSKLHFSTPKSAMASSVPLSHHRGKWQGSGRHLSPGQQQVRKWQTFLEDSWRWQPLTKLTTAHPEDSCLWGISIFAVPGRRGTADLSCLSSVTRLLEKGIMFHTLGHGGLSHRQGRGPWNAGGMLLSSLPPKCSFTGRGSQQLAASDPSLGHDFWPP